MASRVYVIGVGTTKFEKPGARDWDYPDMGREAGLAALADAGVDYGTVEAAAVGYVYGDSTCGQTAIYELGLTQFQDEYSLDQILASPMVYEPLTKLHCCPTSDGGVAAILANDRFVTEHGLQDRAVEIAGIAMTTDTSETFSGSDMDIVGYQFARAAARQVYEASGLGPEGVQVIELHDCFSVNELVAYDALALCEPGNAGILVDEGATTHGGRWVVNPSGGLISKGYPLGATGLAQCTELTWQIRGQAGPRQVPDARAALQHSIGLGGAAVVAIDRSASA